MNYLDEVPNTVKTQKRRTQVQRFLFATKTISDRGDGDGMSNDGARVPGCL